jgi:hypothetical protein
MEIGHVPAALQDRLGLEATTGLVQLLERTRRDWKADVIAMCTERFERRVEDIAAVRLHIAQVEMSIRRDRAEMGAGIRLEMTEMGASIRQEMTEIGASIRQEMTGMGASIRQEMTEMGASIRQDMSRMDGSIRQDMAAMGAGIRQELAAGRVELLKWCFLFWIGQVFAVAGIMAMMLRAFRP